MLKMLKGGMISIRVINVIRSWIESYLSDEDAESVLQRVSEFAARDMGDSSLSRQVALTCERRVSGCTPNMFVLNHDRY